MPDRIFKYGSWIISIVFILRAIGEFKYIGFFKKIKTYAFWEARHKILLAFMRFD
ncbi:DUF3995 domain-containing protein [Flavivirga sp. Y03]|uniref:DUF3995 domain-containing protein n=1 Tax=Flavivirga algicola TaxID=2729136 RepID=A0ABX1S406_9FLAO|nr:DUF3995 domain-containing protein [Flavivirga algicola]